MNNRILLKTNLWVCLVVMIGFISTAVLNYRINYDRAVQNVEQMPVLAAEGIYQRVDAIFAEPVSVSRAMANDSLLKDFLRDESCIPHEPYIHEMQEYLGGYRNIYGFDSVFLVSEATARYYHFDGLDRILIAGRPNNAWYYDGIRVSEDEYNISVDIDTVTDNAITFFVNSKIRDDTGRLLGVVGVGFKVESIQQMLQAYFNKYDISAYIIDSDGYIKASAQYTDSQHLNLFELMELQQVDWQQIMDRHSNDEVQGLWTSTYRDQSYTVTRYMPDINWHLVLVQHTNRIMEQTTRNLSLLFIFVMVILVVILALITSVIGRFNKRLITLTQQMERERKSVFEKATEKLFEDVYEMDITHNRPTNQSTEAFLQSVGAAPGVSYDKALHVIAQKQIKEEFRQGYLDTLLPENVMRAHEQGIDSLKYDCMITKDGERYYWIRIIARIVVWESDQSIHLLVYRQNIDEEKRKEERLEQLASMDEMTGLLSKTTTQCRIEQLLKERQGRLGALLIMDIDNFKQANDLYGHAFGDKVILSFARSLLSSFSNEALVGRIGGDEFAVFLWVDSVKTAEEKARVLCQTAGSCQCWADVGWQMSVSVGIACAPMDGEAFAELYEHADTALYQAKRHNRGGHALSPNAQHEL